MIDEVRRAYAVLGLPQGTSFSEVRRRYLLLAKRWHPDRFSGDPTAEGQAGERMRTFNSAYHVLVDHLADRGVTTSTAPSVGSARKPGERLSREEIERMVASINKPGPVDSFLNAVGWVGSRIEAAWFALFVVAATLRLTYLAFTGQFGELIQETKRHPELFFLLVALIGMGVAEVRRRSVLQEHGSSMGTHRLRERSGT